MNNGSHNVLLCLFVCLPVTDSDLGGSNAVDDFFTILLFLSIIFRDFSQTFILIVIALINNVIYRVAIENGAELAAETSGFLLLIKL